jgi:hypothetical protein
MSTLSFYSRSKDFCGENELLQIKKEYEVNLFNIMEIGKIHKRTPGCISYKLKSLGLIEHNTNARGYTEYRNSPLYREIVESYMSIKTANPNKKQKKEPVNNELKILRVKPQILIKKDVNQEIIDIKKDISNIRKDISEVLTLMKSIYEFESE